MMKEKPSLEMRVTCVVDIVWGVCGKGGVCGREGGGEERGGLGG